MVNITPRAINGSKGWQFSASAAFDMVECLNTLAAAGYQAAVKCGQDPDDPAVIVWGLDLFKQNYPILKVVVDDWIVWDGVVAAIYPSEDFSDKFDVIDMSSEPPVKGL